MSNTQTSAKRYNKKLNDIFTEARHNGAIATSDAPINPFLIHKLKTIFGLNDGQAVQAVNMVRTLDRA